MADGAQMLAIPGIGFAVPARDPEQRIIVNQIVLLAPGLPPTLISETLGSLEEKFNGPTVLL
jgi:hypothetical protein